MSAAEEEGSKMCCASCGIAGVDDIKLKDCDGCDLMKYCSDACQKEHKSQHKQECKKRAAELRDEILFKQPESSYLGDCPICCLPFPLDTSKWVLNSCCGKRICNGCDIANKNRELLLWTLQNKCPFCRKALPETKEQINEQLMKRIEANDPAAMCVMGVNRFMEGDYKTAFEYLTRAAALGDALTHYQLSLLYRDGEGVEKNEERELHHLTEAAIGGHPMARHSLGCVEAQCGRTARAVKHLIIAAKLGVDESLESIKNLYKAGYVTKDYFAAALRGHQAAIDATKSPQRDEAEESDLCGPRA